MTNRPKHAIFRVYACCKHCGGEGSIDIQACRSYKAARKAAARFRQADRKQGNHNWDYEVVRSTT